MGSPTLSRPGYSLPVGVGGLFYEMVLLDEVIQVLSSEDDPAAKFDAGEALPNKVVQNAAANF